MHDFLPEFGRILATSKAKYLKKILKFFPKKIYDFGLKIGQKRGPKKARWAFGRARAAQKSPGRAGQARKPEHHYTPAQGPRVGPGPKSLNHH